MKRVKRFLTIFFWSNYGVVVIGAVLVIIHLWE